MAFEEDLADLKKARTKRNGTCRHKTPYYNPSYNEIFSGSILQPPFYNYQADEAVNYGGIGGVIGHEISHGFDDQDLDIMLMVIWWTGGQLMI
jgi:endothelin-converting enzyme/putative endopeptidase